MDSFASQVATLPVDSEQSGNETNTTQALYRSNAVYQPALLNVLNTAQAGSFQWLNSSSLAGAAPALTAGSATRLPNADTMPFYIQEGNACGTTTLAEIMSYLGKTMTQSDVDAAIRRMDVFTAPSDMIDFARENGLEAEGYNHGSWEEVKAMIDAGHPVQAMVSGDSGVAVENGSNPGNFSVDGLHYIVITGHGTDPATGEEVVTYHDPNRGSEQQMSVSDFEKMWGDVPGGFDNYFIAYGPKGSDLPAGRDDGIEGTLGTLNGVTNLTNGLNRIYNPDSWGGFVHGLFEVSGGIPQTIGSFVGGGLQIGADWFNDQVDGIPVLQNIAKPFGDMVNGAGAVLGDVFNGVGESLDDFGSAFEDLSHGNWDKFTDHMADAAVDVGGAVVDAVSDTVDAVGDAIGDLFDW